MIYLVSGVRCSHITQLDSITIKKSPRNKRRDFFIFVGSEGLEPATFRV